jgi:RNA 3'-terminal phosphate cyclase (ATP)
MNWNANCARVDEVTAHGPGNVVSAQLEYEHVTEVITGFGRIGASAENVAKEVIRDTRNYLKNDVPVGEYLADQILLPLGISAWQNGSHRRGGSFRTMPLSRHSTTHIELLRQILGIDISVVNNEDPHQSTVTLGPMARTL